jgi:hypothetical protein
MKQFTYKDFDTATVSVCDDLVASIEKHFDINLAPNEKFYKLFEGVESIIAEHIEILEEDE